MSNKGNAIGIYKERRYQFDIQIEEADGDIVNIEGVCLGLSMHDANRQIQKAYPSMVSMKSLIELGPN